MHILLTRPAQDSARLARRLEAAGHRVTSAPVMRIVHNEGPMLDLGPYQALLLTSANGARAIGRRSLRRDLPVLAVGGATAAAAQAEGFSTIASAGGDVYSLAELAKARLDPAAGPVLHAAGKVIAGDLAQLLPEINVVRAVLYEAVATDALPAAALQAIRSAGIDLALFYSPRSARLFMDLAERSGVLPDLSRISAGVLSANTRDALQSARWRRIVVAKWPSEQALLEAVGLQGGEDDQ